MPLSFKGLFQIVTTGIGQYGHWKGKETKNIYIALFYQASQSAQTWITQFYLQITPCLPFLRKRSPDVATPTEVEDI